MKEGFARLLRFYKDEELVPSSSTVPPPAPLVMTASVHSSKTPTIENEKDRDVESLGKAEDADVSAEDDNSSSEKGPSQWEVTLEKSEDPRSMATWYKWFIVIMVSCGTMCATCAPSMVSAT